MILGLLDSFVLFLPGFVLGLTSTPLSKSSASFSGFIIMLLFGSPKKCAAASCEQICVAPLTPDPLPLFSFSQALLPCSWQFISKLCFSCLLPNSSISWKFHSGLSILTLRLAPKPACSCSHSLSGPSQHPSYRLPSKGISAVNTTLTQPYVFGVQLVFPLFFSALLFPLSEL